jgi:hypothetical protein
VLVARISATWLVLVLTALPLVAFAEDGSPPAHSALGPGLGINAPDDGGRVCPTQPSTFYKNCDWSFETAYAWQYGGVAPPYYGAFAEGFQEPGILDCVDLFVTTLPGYYYSQTVDIYVWGSEDGNPSNVLSMTPGVILSNVPSWPTVAENSVTVHQVALPHEYFVGYWGNWPGEQCGWYIGADLNGPGGLPRTNVAPGVGYPTGWTDPSEIWGHTAALGIGVWIEPGIPCCYADGSCYLTTSPFNCDGQVLNSETCDDCAAAVTGACCRSDGSCAVTTRFDCGSGDWRVGEACEPNPCPAVQLGACCVEGVCTLTEEGDCPGGSWLGPGTFCQPNPCPAPPEMTADCAVYDSYAHWVGGTMATYSQTVVPANGYVCVGAMQVVDIADPRNPVVRSELALHGRVMAASGTRVYAAGVNSRTFEVADIADPDAPVILGSAELPDGGTSIAVQGGFAYLLTCCDEPRQLLVLDVSVPQHPTILGSVGVSAHEANGVAVRGGYAYVAAGAAGLLVVDVSDPRAPRIVATANTPGSASAVALDETRAYVADYTSLVVIDISNPEDPEIEAVMPDPVPGGFCDVAVSGDFACVATSTVNSYCHGLVTVDISDPRFPEPIGCVTLTETSDFNPETARVALVGTLACVAAESEGLQLIDVANPRSATIVGRVDLSSVGELTIAGTHGYVASRDDGLQVVDVSDPSAPQAVGSAALPGYCYSAAVAGEQLLATGGYDLGGCDSGGYLQVFDISVPARPRPQGSVDLSGCGWRVAGAGRYAAVLDWGETPYFRMIDISDPQDPQIVGSLALPGSPCDIALSGNYAFVADGCAGLLAIDITDPSRLRIAASSKIQNFCAQAVGTFGGLACVALSSGIQVVDISEPGVLRTVGLTYLSWSPSGVTMQGTHAAIADEDMGIQIIDLSTPSNPRIVGSVSGSARDVQAANGYLYASCYRRPGEYYGFEVLRAPCEPTGGDGEGASVSEGTAGASGVRTLQNPAVRQATIRLELAAGGFVHATIHDLSGRRVRDLFTGRVPAATRDLTWDGRDDRGQSVAAGVYVARIATTAGTTTRRLVLLR